MSILIPFVNRQLEEIYGKDLTSELPIWRIVFSDDQLETRFGEFNHFVGNSLIRTTKEIAEVPKYPFIKHRHVLERLVYHTNPELMDNPSYEPMYVFQDKHGNSLDVELWVCQARIQMLFSDPVKKTESDHQAEYDAQMKKEKAVCKDILANDRPYIPTMIELGEAVSLPKVDKWERYNEPASSGSDSSECVPLENRGIKAGSSSGAVCNSGS
jgi:hypothetical protein